MPTRRQRRQLDDGYRISDESWSVIQALIPPGKPHPLGCHRPRMPDRVVMDAIFLVLRTGMPWSALNTVGPCNAGVAFKRFVEWSAAGLFEQIHRLGFAGSDHATEFDWTWLLEYRSNLNSI